MVIPVYNNYNISCAVLGELIDKRTVDVVSLYCVQNSAQKSIPRQGFKIVPVFVLFVFEALKPWLPK